MRLNLLSFNARGLNEPSAVDALQLYIQDCRPVPDIVLVQEHKCRGVALTNLGKSLWRHATFWGRDASPGYGHLDSEDGAGCGGLASFLAHKWASLVSDSGSLFENRVHWFIMSGLPGGDLGIANIYAHNNSADRCSLWETMARELPTHCRWLLLGDFNMVEMRTDKNRPCASMISRRERELFDSMKRTLQVEDNPRIPGSLKFSWDNSRATGIRALARLDRMYVFPSQPASPGRQILRYEIRGDMTRSDHCPIFASIQLAERPPQAHHWKMSTLWFQEAGPEIRRLWTEAPPNASFFMKMRTVTRAYRKFCKLKSASFRAEEDRMKQELDEATGRL